MALQSARMVVIVMVICVSHPHVCPTRIYLFLQRMAHQWLRTLNDLRRAVHGPVNYSTMIISADRESFSNENQMKWSVANSDSIGSTVERVRIIVRRVICINTGEQSAQRWIISMPNWQEVRNIHIKFAINSKWDSGRLLTSVYLFICLCLRQTCKQFANCFLFTFVRRLISVTLKTCCSLIGPFLVAARAVIGCCY